MKHYLFDFDGVLVDSMPTWAGEHIKALEDAGIEPPADFVKTITPLGNYKASLYTISFGLDISIEEYLEKLSRKLNKAYSTFISLKPNVKETLEKLSKEGIALHVLTASPHSYVDDCLKRHGVFELFQNVWTIEDFSLTKAEPEIYIEAVKRLDASPKNCTMFDDNIVALKTAKAAGFSAIGVYDETSKDLQNDIKSISDKYIYNFGEL